MVPKFSTFISESSGCGDRGQCSKPGVGGAEAGLSK